MAPVLPADAATRWCILLLTCLTLLVHAIKFPDFSGFWAGADQHYLLDSARAWATGDLAPARHHYLPFFTMLTAPFVWLTPWQPFMVPDLVCLLACMLVFARIAARLAPGWPPAISAVCFTVAVLSGRQVFALWIVPWTTTGSAPLQYLGVLLAMRFVEQPEPARGAAWAFVVMLVAGFRPSDAAILALGTASFIAVALLRVTRLRDQLRMMVAMLAGGLGATLPLVAAHAAIFGLSPGPYLAKSAAIGFEWRLLPIRWVMIVLDPRPVLPDGGGLAMRLPWLLPGIAGLIFSVIGKPGPRTQANLLVACTVALHWACYLCYRDLQPTGLWRFNLVHYFKWTFPFLVLWAVQISAGLVFQRERSRSILTLAFAVPLFTLRPALRDPRPVPLTGSGREITFKSSSSRPGQALQLPLLGSWNAIYFQNFVLHVAGFAFQNTQDFKVLPISGGALLLPLRSLPQGPAQLELPSNVTLAQYTSGTAFRLVIRPGLPCALFPRRMNCEPTSQTSAVQF